MKPQILLILGIVAIFLLAGFASMTGFFVTPFCETKSLTIYSYPVSRTITEDTITTDCDKACREYFGSGFSETKINYNTYSSDFIIVKCLCGVYTCGS